MTPEEIKVLSDVSKYDEPTRQALATAIQVAFAAAQRGILPNEAVPDESWKTKTCSTCSSFDEAFGGTGFVCSYHAYALKPTYTACQDYQVN